jgi:tetratricopeptide (TPR) repeat protein
MNINEDEGQKILLLNKAHDLISRNKYEDALYNVNLILEHDKRNINALYIKGVIYGRLKLRDQSKICYHEIIGILENENEFSHNKFESLYILGKTYTRLIQFNKALNVFNLLIEYDSLYDDVHLMKGICLFHDQEINETTEIKCCFPFCKCTKSDDNYYKAIEEFEKSIEIYPDRPDGYYWIGVCYMQLNNMKFKKRHKKAYDWFKKAYETEQNFKHTYMTREDLKHCVDKSYNYMNMSKCDSCCFDFCC